MVPGELNVYLWRDVFHLFFPMRGRDHWRVVGIVPWELRGRDDLEFAAVIPSIRKQAGDALVFQECRWFSTYRISHRHAERFRDRHCFLLGDAAHIHSPVGAQGEHGLRMRQPGMKLGSSPLDAPPNRFSSRTKPKDSRLRSGCSKQPTKHRSSCPIGGSAGSTHAPACQNVAFAMRFERAQKFAFRTISQIGFNQESSLSENLPGLLEDGRVRAIAFLGEAQASPGVRKICSTVSMTRGST